MSGPLLAQNFVCTGAMTRPLFLLSLPPDLVGSVVLSNLALSDIVRLDTAVQQKYSRSDLLASYKACHPVDLPNDLPSRTLIDAVHWMFRRNIRIGRLLIDELNMAILHFIAYNSHWFTGDIVLHLHFGTNAWKLFLQQDYSASLLPRISELHMRTARTGRPGHAVPTGSLPLCHLKSLSCDSHEMYFAEVIQNNPLLSTLRLEVDSPISDRLMAAIVVRRKTLSSLELVGRYVTDADLQEIGSACNFLTEFSLDCSGVPNRELRVTDAGVCAVLTGCPRVENLTVVCSAVTGTALAFALTHCPRLDCIQMKSTLLDDRALLERPPDAVPLRKLACYWCVAERYCHLLSGIVELNIAVEEVSIQTFGIALGAMPQLRCLTLRTHLHHHISVNVLHVVAQTCTQLTSLVITACIQGDAESAFIQIARANPGLTELCERGGVKGFTDAVMLALAENCPKLAMLHVYCSDKLSDSSLTALAHSCRKLAELELQNCKHMTDRTLYALAERCRHLCTLRIGMCTQIQEPAIAQLAHSCRRLHSLTVHDECLTHDEATALQVACAPRLKIHRQCPPKGRYLLI